MNTIEYFVEYKSTNLQPMWKYASKYKDVEGILMYTDHK